MSKSVMILCAAATRSSRIGAFGDPGEPLDDGGRRAAAAFAVAARFRGQAVTSPAQSATATATLLNLDAREEAALRDMDHGLWSGRDLAAVEADSADALAAWLADPTSGAPGGETMEAVRARTGAWLDRVAGNDAPTVAVTHPMVVRCLLAHALSLPLAATLAIDIAPLSRTTLSFNRIWRLQSLEPHRL